MRPAEIPSQNWNRGHRGVDLPAQEDDLLVAPDDGIITFAGSVAGKNVVTLELIEKSYGEPIHVSFEPATTTLKTGDFLARGDPFALASGGSDHCGTTCVHVGVRINKAYCDPLIFLLHRGVRLKPVDPDDAISPDDKSS